MPTIPLFVSASGILVAIAGGFALALAVLDRRYGRSHLRQWMWMWVALAVYALGSGSALLAVNRPSLGGLRVLASLVALGGAWWHLAALDAGVREFLGRARRDALHPAILIGVPILIAAFLVLTPVPADPDERLARYVVRLLVLAVVWGGTYVIAGTRLLREDALDAILGQRVVGVAMIAYGVLRIGEPFLHFVGPNPLLAQVVTFGGLPLLVALGAGMLIALLDVERARALDAAATSHALQRAADASEAALTARLDRQRERFRSLIEHSSDIIFLLTADGRIEYVSPSLTAVLGWTPNELIGDDPFGFVHPDDRASLRDAMSRAFESDPTLPRGVPFRARHRNGTWVRLESVARTFVEPDGTPRLIVSARDVRERLRLEGELLAARRLESVGRLAGGIAHDFNNLLTAVLGNVSLLRAHVASDEGREHLDEIQQAARRGADLVARLLAFARRRIVEPKALDLAEQVRGIEALLRRLLPADIALRIEAAPATWMVRADPAAVEQSLINLVMNARDAMPSGGRLAISIANHTISDAGHVDLGVPAGEWVRVDVSDTGVGIEEQSLGRIFEPFFTTKGEAGGTGLGLATVFGSMAQAGGHVRVRSTAGEGATFSLFFPRIGQIAGAEPDATATDGVPFARPGEVVLLVEDEPGVRAVTARLLHDLGYAVLTAAGGDEAISVAAAHPGRIHAVVSDLVLPNAGGVEIVAHIRRARPRLGVVLMSASSEGTLEWRPGELPPGSPWLRKPFSLVELARAVRTAIDASRGSEVAVG